MELICDLERHFGRVLDALPSDPGEEFEFTAGNLPSLKIPLSSNAIVIRTHLVSRQDAVTDRLCFYLRRRTLRLLGLLLLSRLFHPKPDELFLNIASETTEVRDIVIDTMQSAFGFGFTASYHRRASSFEYYRRVDERWPLAQCDPRACPAFYLTKGEFGPASREDWLTRDRIRLTGTDTAILDLAQVFLDLGRSDSSLLEFDLETELGNGGVAHRSAELKVWLPGSDGWLDDDLPE